MDKVASLVARLAEKYDGEALVEGLVALVERIDKALDDGKVSVIESITIGLAFVKLFVSTRRKA